MAVKASDRAKRKLAQMHNNLEKVLLDGIELEELMKENQVEETIHLGLILAGTLEVQKSLEALAFQLWMMEASQFENWR